ncbi:hypothetical protein POVWA2_003440 [Plasmodium ovale wallikeri]|uniref:Uncharacterized protein n=1 Tax=Plasmodium ovale wallikeri TaxID=864142 RepID=A0A1A8YHD1_PLAOA|nr:hypothetical protein POVWA1_003250 [Plasmodium ovale wallikeri]SBT31302.1 hypothetical protein POVWA2_003440 [Plasmodium ovale wallikeri]
MYTLCVLAQTWEEGGRCTAEWGKSKTTSQPPGRLLAATWEVDFDRLQVFFLRNAHEGKHVHGSGLI